jgi:hypothetical protein
MGGVSLTRAPIVANVPCTLQARQKQEAPADTGACVIQRELTLLQR